MKRLFMLALSFIVAAMMTVPVFAETSDEPQIQPTVAVEQSTEPVNNSISSKDALNIALKNAGLSSTQVKMVEVELERGIYEVEFIRQSNNAEYEYDIVQKNGAITKKNIEYKVKKTKSKKKIGKTKARKAVAKYAKLPYNVIKKGSCRFDKEKRGSKYEIKFTYNGMKYECDVLARNGKIMEYGWKR